MNPSSPQLREQLRAVHSPHSTPQELEQLLLTTPFEDVMRAGIGRSDTTAERLNLIARRSHDANTLGRLVSHPLTPIETVRDIRDTAHELAGGEEVWLFLYQYAGRVVRRRETGVFEFGQDEQ